MKVNNSLVDLIRLVCTQAHRPTRLMLVRATAHRTEFPGQRYGPYAKVALRLLPGLVSCCSIFHVGLVNPEARPGLSLALIRLHVSLKFRGPICSFSE
jgi:hypothetical protein